MPNSDKTFGWYMHKKPADKFSAGDGAFFPLTFFPVILHIVGNSIFIHADDPMVADCYRLKDSILEAL